MPACGYSGPHSRQDMHRQTKKKGIKTNSYRHRQANRKTRYRQLKSKKQTTKRISIKTNTNTVREINKDRFGQRETDRSDLP